MTTNQVEYVKAQETERHNREMEKYYSGTLEESIRHSKATEEETKRHDFGDESIRAAANDINYFAAMENSAHLRRQDEETNRSNQVREVETERHDRATEVNQSKQAAASMFAASAAWKQAEVQEARLPFEKTSALAAYSQAKSRESEVNNQNLLRDTQRLSTLKQTDPNVENVKSQTDLNRSREEESRWSANQKKLDYFYSPMDRIIGLQNDLGKGVGYGVGRRNLNETRIQQTKQPKTREEQEIANVRAYFGF